MLSGKVLARTFYQQGSFIQNKTNSEETKSVSQIFQKKEKKEKEVDNFFYPKEKDQLFWCFFIIQNGFEKYEYPDATSFVNEKTTKFKLIEHMRHNKQQLKSKKIKNIKEDVEDELANKQTIGMKTFIALCISHNINIIYIHKRKCFEMIFDEQSPKHVVHCCNNSDSSSYKYCYQQNVTKEQLETYRMEYFTWENFDKPLKAMSSYKLDELTELAKKLGLSENGGDLSKKTKKDLYEMLVMNL
jgi:hypothetical protein